MGFSGLLSLPLSRALSLHSFEDVFQNDPSGQDVADLHRKLRGETHYQIKMIYLWSCLTVVCTRSLRKYNFGATQIARW